MRNDVKCMSLLTGRSSVRVFDERPVESNSITQLLQAAMQAPSARNQQPWHFLVVKNRAKLDALALVSQGARHLYGAPCAIIPCIQEGITKMPHTRPLDVSAATQNILLSAHEQGLGAVWVCVFPLAYRMEAVREILNIPADLTPFAMIPIGYPKHPTPPPPLRYDEAKVTVIP